MRADQDRSAPGRVLAGSLLLAIVGCGQAAATPEQDPAGQEASAARARAHVEFLASDEMRGRASGTREFDRAADYVEAHLSELGLDPLFDGSYRQPYAIERVRFSGEGALIYSNGSATERFAEQVDMAFMGVEAGRDAGAELGLAYVGLGIHEPAAGWDDYAGIDLTDRCALMMLDTPSELVQHFPPHLYARYTNLAVGPNTKAWTGIRQGAACVIAFPSSSAPAGFAEQMRSAAILQQTIVLPSGAGGATIGTAVVVSSRAAARLLGVDDTDPGANVSRLLDGTVSFEASWRSESTANASNVGAVIPGSDPELSHEVIVLSAHLDGQGMSGEDILNSANDNASSVAALLEASRLIRDVRPRRTVQLLFTASEEDGLLGSRHFVDHPPGDAEAVRLNVNMEMIGKPRRSADSHQFRVSSRVAPELESIVHEVERSIPGVEFDYLHRSDDDGRRIFRNADHVNFFLRGIPTLYFYGGDESYHQASDDPDGINFDKVAKMADLLLAVVRITDAMERLPGW